MHHALNLPLFGPLADVGAVEVAEAADEAGFDGLFCWDHVLSPVDGDWEIADPWVALSAVAARTSRIAIGPMVTPIARRRLSTLVRTTSSLDRLSQGGSSWASGWAETGRESSPRSASRMTGRCARPS